MKLCWDHRVAAMRWGHISGAGDSRDVTPACVFRPRQGCGCSCLPAPSVPQGTYLLAEVDVAPCVLVELVAIEQQRQDVNPHRAVCV